MSKSQANLLCLLVALIWGGGFIATDAALNTFAPFTVLLIRFVGAALVAWIVLCFLKLPVSLAAVKKGTLCGMFMYAAFAFQTFGLAYTETGSNAFLTSVNVILVPYITWIVFRRRPKGLQLIASVICLAGIGLLCLSAGHFTFRFGDLLSLTCALFFAFHIVALEWACQKENPQVINTIQMSTAAIMAIPLAWKFESWPSHISWAAIFSCFYMICIATWLAFFLQSLAQKYTDASSASLLLGTESLWANVFGWLLLHESKTPAMLAGGGLILLAVLLCEGESMISSLRKKINAYIFRKNHIL